MPNGPGGSDAPPEPLPSVASIDAVGDLRWAGAGGAGPTVDLTAAETTGPVLDLALADRRVRRPRRGILQAHPALLAAKRAVDLVGSVLLLVAFAPILLVAAVAVAATSRGPVLYVQERVGRRGRSFRMLKFRSMRRNAHDERHLLTHLSHMSGPAFKVRDDPRVTRVGRILRKLSIDELPQLVNVLRGDMSLVGPRPPLPEEFAAYGPRERARLAVRPGITCSWQISGRSDIGFDEWVAMDLEYIATWTLAKDIAILARTLPAVVSGRGAY